MSDDISGAPFDTLNGFSPHKSEPLDVALVAILALAMATGAALGRRRRRRFIRRLSLIALDWEAEGAGAVLATAARRFIRPALQLLRNERA